MKKESAAEAYPLYWPDGWARTKHPRVSNFQIKLFGKVRDGVIKSLSMGGARGVVLSTNIPLRLDGLPYANMPNPQDAGAAVYWYDPKTDQQRSMACDRWNKVIDNLRAIELSLEALRGLERWGSSEIVQRAFSGFMALPETATGWRAVFGIPSSARPPIAEVKELYRHLALVRHPDTGGSEQEMNELNSAMSAAKQELS